ncbi:MAG TPA: hypothetical protein VKU00_14270 [Chthonomonadaceae bacterium]|nr:hypothetical protein [Chthonomonadaceae bacterium]
MFHEAPGGSGAWWGWVIGSLVVSAVFLALLQLIPQRFRRYVILAITFLGGLYFALEFFLPTHAMPTPQDPKAEGNFLTPYLVPFGNVATVIGAWTVGVGVLNLCQVHGRRLTRGGSNVIYSFAFFVSMIAMLVFGLLKDVNKTFTDIYDLLFMHGLNTLDATMFSIIAFYIVSAAYRAFRVRSAEATLLLITAVIVMLGQVAVGQMLTSAIPKDSMLAFLRIEGIRNWVLTIINAAATRAIGFGLGIGGLAVALRIWLGLERGSYFE